MKLEDLLYLAAIGAIAYVVLRHVSEKKYQSCYQECMETVGNSAYCAQICRGTPP